MGEPISESSIPSAEQSYVETPEAPPSWRRSLHVAWLAQLISISAFFCISPFMPFYIRELGVKDERMVALWSGGLLTGSGAMMALCAPFWGSLADRYGRKLMVQRAMFGGAVVISLMGLVTSIYQLLALRMIQGALTGTIPASVALVSSFTPSSKRGYSLGLLQMAVFSGGAIGPWIGGVVADHAGYRIPFALTGLLLFLAGLMVTVGISEPNFRVCAPSGGTSPTTLGGLLSRRSFDLLLAVIFLVSFSTMLVAPVLPLFVEHLMPARERVSSTVGLLMAVVGIAAGFGSVLMGRISDCFGSKLTLLVCTLSSGLGSVLQGFVSTVAQLFALRVGFGLVAGGTQPTVNTLVASSVPEDAFGKAYGLTSSANAIGMASGPMVGGLIASSMGLRAPFVVAGILLIAISGGIAFRLGVARKA